MTKVTKKSASGGPEDAPDGAALAEDYDLELDRVVEEIRAQKAKLVCLQLPDGLKPVSGEIVREIRRKTDAQVFIWAGSCFGACDVPLEVERLGVDLIVQFGHSEWRWS